MIGDAALALAAVTAKVAGRTLRRTGGLRWLSTDAGMIASETGSMHRAPSSPGRLQEEWQFTDTGESSWVDIPMVAEQDAP